MAKVLGEIIIDIENCKGCELCFDACPKEALVLSDTINSKGYQYAVKINHNCNGCASCAMVCPEAVIKVYRKVEKGNKPPKKETIKVENL
jgi:2-oxoglutarate ferredoxin oxidoreductase subunit delta